MQRWMGSPPLLRLNGATDSLSGDAPAPEATTGASYNSRDNSMAYASAGGVTAQGWFYDSKREFTDGGDRDDRRGAQGSTLLSLTPNRPAFAAEQESLRLAKGDRLGFARCESYQWSAGEVQDNLGAWNGDLSIVERGSALGRPNEKDPVNMRSAGGRPAPARSVVFSARVFTGAPAPNGDAAILQLGMSWMEQHPDTLEYKRALARFSGGAPSGAETGFDGWAPGGYNSFTLNESTGALARGAYSPYSASRAAAIASAQISPASATEWGFWLESYTGARTLQTQLIGQNRADGASVGIPSLPKSFARSAYIGARLMGVSVSGYWRASASDVASANPTGKAANWIKQIRAISASGRAQICGKWIA